MPKNSFGKQQQKQNIFILVIGATSLLMQIIALRKLMTIFSGNELIIGIALAAWLIAVAAGSILGKFFQASGRALAFTFIALSFLTQPSILIMDVIPALFSLEPGETIPLGAAIAGAFLVLSPLGIVLGSQFSLSVPFLKGNAPRVYALEAAGACLGGILFTLLLSGRVSTLGTASLLSVINILIAAMLFGKKPVMLLLVFPVSLYFGAGSIISRAPGNTMTPVQKTESRYGEIAVFRDRDQVNVFASGKFRFSYPDHASEEMKAHVPLSLHDAPSEVMVIGGSPAVVREVLKYNVSGVSFVEIDPVMIRVYHGIISQEDQRILKSKRVRIITTDARKFVKSVQQRSFDLVLLNLPEPSTADINRLYTVEFFREVKAAMKQNGIFCLSLPVSSGYISRRLRIAIGSVSASLKTVFPQIAVSSEEYGGLYASDGLIEVRPQILLKRFIARRIETRHFYPLLFKDIFDPLKIEMVKKRVEGDFALNTDDRPAAYLYNLLLWTEMHGGRILDLISGINETAIIISLAAVIPIASVGFWRRRQSIYYSVFTGGYFSMALSVVILLSFQAAYGYLYESIGMMTAMFMAGLAGGAWFASRFMRPLFWLRSLEVAAVVLALCAPLFFTHEYLYFILSLLTGSIGGMQFSAATRYSGGKEKGNSAAMLYAIDLAGSVAGALVITLLFIPLFGVTQALLSLMALKTSSLILLFSLSERKEMCKLNLS